MYIFQYLFPNKCSNITYYYIFVTNKKVTCEAKKENHKKPK